MTKAVSQRDTRRFDRRDTLLPVTVRAAGNKVEAGIRLDAGDLSEGGVFLRSDLLFEVGENLTVEIPIANGETLSAQGRVVRVSRGTKQNASPGMGIEFIQLSAEERRALITALRQTPPRGGDDSK